MQIAVLLLMLVPVVAPSIRENGGAGVSARSEIDLSAVTDRSELSFDESPAYYELLAKARDIDPGTLAAAAHELRNQRRQSTKELRTVPEADFPAFVDLIEHPDEYRGQPVTLSGHVIRLVSYPAGPNDAGIDTLYEAWIVTEDSQQHPATVILTELPDGMPLGEELIDGVTVTGYFLKLHTYPSRDKKTRFAPMILARTFSWRPPDNAHRQFLRAPWTFLFAAGALIAGAVAFIWSMNRRWPHRIEQHPQSLPDEPPDFLKTLAP
ncbi:MAG: hypothetical protein KF861_12435 [Planctomycetaceae bacterium]|nr:hypothetical protein [Planctomycetaceae bacterium]